MGEIAEMMVNGLLCQSCGVLMDDHEEPGYPRSCAACQHEDRVAHSLANPSEKVKCPKCSKRVKAVGLADHVRDVHGYPSEPPATEHAPEVKP